MEKAIYGLAAHYDTYLPNKVVCNFEKINKNTVKYSKNVALTIDHDYQKTITTNLNKENGELILVQSDENLFFKFIPTTKEGERIYQAVKNGEYNRCSFMYYVLNKKRDLEQELAIRYVKEGYFSLSTVDAVVFEVCITNNPANKETFVTTNPNHLMLLDIDWETNIQFGDEDYWQEHIEHQKIGNELKVMEQRFKDFDKKMEELKKERGFTQC